MTELSRHIFVTYARADTHRVAPIIKALREQGLDVWLDQEDIAGATFWRKEIVQAITECSIVVFFATKLSCRSENVSKELALANDEKKPILPVLLDDVEPSAELRYQIAGLQKIAWFSNPALARQQISAALQRYVPRSNSGLTNFQGSLERPRKCGRWPSVTMLALLGVLGVAVIAGVTIGVSRWRGSVSRSRTAERAPVKPATVPVVQPAVPAPAVSLLPRLANVWHVETTTTASDYSPYRGLRVRYRVLLSQNGTALDVRGEKIGEVDKGEVNELTGRGKTPIHLAGQLEPQAGGKFKVILNGEEGSTQRGSFSTFFELRVDSTDTLTGSFSSTAANVSGQAIWMSEALWRTSGWPAR
jgi:hypothetical protein